MDTLRKKSMEEHEVSGHDFSRADMGVKDAGFNSCGTVPIKGLIGNSACKRLIS
jgi:hypothetical protein